MPYIEGSIAGHKRYHTSKDPNYRTSFCPKSLDQNKNQVHPILCEGVSLHRRWNCLWRHKVIYQFFHPCSQFLIIVHGGSFLFGGDKNLKITALSFISTGPDRCACKELLVPSTWTKCSSRHLSSLSIMWKVKQDPFFADSRGLHHLYSAAHHWGSGFHSCGGRGVFKVYIHHLAKLWSLILLQRKGSYHTKIQLSTKQSFQFSFNIEVSFLGSPSSNWDLCWSSLGHPQWQKAGSCHSLFFHWAKPKPFVCSSLSLENLYHPCIWYHLHLFHRW